MKINIPRLQSEHIVAKDVIVPIEGEHRNIKFLYNRGVIGNIDPNRYHIFQCPNCNAIETHYRCQCGTDLWDHLAKFQITIPAGVKLIFDRYYIRNGSPEFDSVSFRYHAGKEKSRFWIKLADAEQIEFI